MNRSPEAIEKRVIETFGEEMANSIKNLDEHLIPLAKLYLEALRGIRMGVGNEVRDIIQSSMQIRDMAKPEHIDNLIKFTNQCALLREIIADEKFVEGLKRLLGDKE